MDAEVIRKMNELLRKEDELKYYSVVKGDTLTAIAGKHGIDLMTSGSGHPVFEMTSMCSVYHMPPKFGNREVSPLLRIFTEEESSEIWDIYLRS